MKKYLLMLVILTGVVLVGCTSGCNGSECVTLPDLTGYVKEDIETELDDLGLTYSFGYYMEENPGHELEFVNYVEMNIGDTISKDKQVFVTIYPAGDTLISLPNLNGKSEIAISEKLDELAISYTFEDVDTKSLYLDGFFVGYKNYNIYDSFDESDSLIVQIYHYNDDAPIGDTYFEIRDMVYDGPLLDDSYASINYLDPRGGYFSVTLKYCTDGDTAVFNYPDDVYDAIESGAKSTRFLNMDTEETYSGGEEEWGKPASVYTCSLLENAEEIIIQTDPGDNLLGNYGRLLGWIWIKQTGEDEFFLLNYMVVKQGLAQVTYLFGAGSIEYGDYTYTEWMFQAQSYAKDNDLGQWGNQLDYYWNYDEDKPFYSRW